MSSPSISYEGGLKEVKYILFFVISKPLQHKPNLLSFLQINHKMFLKFDSELDTVVYLIQKSADVGTYCSSTYII